MLIESKCATCKKFKLIDESPWCVCKAYPENIPDSIYQNPVDSDKPVDCDKYEYNPEWEKKL